MQVGFQTRYGFMKTEKFKGDGSSHIFQVPGIKPSAVYVDGVIQKDTEWAIGSNSVVMFTRPPAKGAEITLVALSIKDVIQELGYDKANEILIEYQNDVKLRNNNPSLEKAWQHYQTIKRLTKS